MVPVKTTDDFKTMNTTRLNLSTAVTASLDFMRGTLLVIPHTIFTPHVHTISCHLVRCILNPCHSSFRNYAGDHRYRGTMCI